MACQNEESDFSKLDKETVCKKLMVCQSKCVTVAKMLDLLAGVSTDFIFLSDPIIADNFFRKAQQDVLDMKLHQEVLFEDSHQSVICEANLCIVCCKKGKNTKARLCVAAAIKVTPFFAMQTEMDDLTFLRLIHVPCKLVLQ